MLPYTTFCMAKIAKHNNDAYQYTLAGVHKLRKKANILFCLQWEERKKRGDKKEGIKNKRKEQKRKEKEFVVVVFQRKKLHVNTKKRNEKNLRIVFIVFHCFSSFFIVFSSFSSFVFF